MSLDEILQTVKAYQPRYITVTGGEPLAQKNCHSLLSKLCDEGYSVSLETSGALDISEVDRRVVVVMDIKTPGSGELMRNKWENLTALKATDQIKFIICHREDYEWSKEILERHQLAEICEILLSPSHGELENQQLASWILADNLPVRFQLQLHKYIWGDLPGY
jgi:7-carboxy-7-deazaguanine synthase